MNRLPRLRRRLSELERRIGDPSTRAATVPTYDELLTALHSGDVEIRHVDELFRLLEPHLRASLLTYGAYLRQARDQQRDTLDDATPVRQAARLVSYRVSETPKAADMYRCACDSPADCFRPSERSACWVRPRLMEKALGPSGGLELRRALDLEIETPGTYSYDASTRTEDLYLLCDPLYAWFDIPLLLGPRGTHTPEHRDRVRRSQERAETRSSRDIDGHGPAG